MALELVGSLIKVLPEVTGQGKNGPWMKQEFVIETFDQYPKKVCLSAWGDKTADLKRYALGDVLKLNISIESREYNERWFTEARAFRIELNEGGTPDQGSQPSGYAPKQAPQPLAAPKVGAATELPSFSQEDDLPF